MGAASLLSPALLSRRSDPEGGPGNTQAVGPRRRQPATGQSPPSIGLRAGDSTDHPRFDGVIVSRALLRACRSRTWPPSAFNSHAVAALSLGPRLRGNAGPEPARPQAGENLEVGNCHERLVRARDEEDLVVLFDRERWPDDDEPFRTFVVLELLEPRLEPRLVCRLRLVRRCPEPLCVAPSAC